MGGVRPSTRVFYRKLLYLFITIIASSFWSFGQTGGSNNQGIECRLVASPAEICVGDTVFFEISNIGNTGPDSCVSPFEINTMAANATFYPFSGHPGFPLPINGSNAVWSNIGFVYNQPGAYNPFLEVITTSGSTMFEPIYMYTNSGFVHPAVITVSDGPDVSLTQQTFTDCFYTGGYIDVSAYLNYPNPSLSVSSQVYVEWGDGTTDAYIYNGSSWPAMDHYYSNPGNYTIELTVSDACGDETLFFTYITDEVDAEFDYSSSCVQCYKRHDGATKKKHIDSQNIIGKAQKRASLTLNGL